MQTIITRRVSEVLGLALASCLLARTATAEDNYAPAAARIQHCVVTFAEQADLSPNEAGILREIMAREGQRVDAGQVLLQLDDRKAQAELEVAKAKLSAAETKANDYINIKYAKAADATAKKELERNRKSNHDVPGSVPAAKIEELELKCVETNLAIEKATHDRTIAESEAAVAAADVKAAEVLIDLHKVKSPIDGVVVDVRVHKGEAVSPAQPVLHIVRLDKLWVEGQVPAAEFAREELENQPVTVDIVGAHGRKASVQGKIVFVKPLTETGGSYMVRAEIKRDNPTELWPFFQGMQADMVIPLRTADAK